MQTGPLTPYELAQQMRWLQPGQMLDREKRAIITQSLRNLQALWLRLLDEEELRLPLDCGDTLEA